MSRRPLLLTLNSSLAARWRATPRNRKRGRGTGNRVMTQDGNREQSSWKLGLEIGGWFASLQPLASSLQ